jgi:hypothetical protein
VVPGKGAIEFVLSDHDYLVAFFYPQGEHLEVLSSEFVRFRSQCIPLLKAHDTLSPDYNTAVKDHIEHDGDRFLVMDGFSEITTPIAIYEKRASPIFEKGGWQAEIANKLLENRKWREAAFRRQMKQEKHWFRDICPKSAIQRLLQEGIPASNDRLLILGGTKETLDQRVAHLKNVIELLKSSTHYELGLLDDEMTKVPPSFWLVKDGRALVLETWLPNATGNMEVLDLEITEPNVVKAFHEYFINLWEHLPSQNRDRQRVISWLEEQIVKIPLGSAEN